MSPSIPTRTSSASVVPQRIRATGVSGARPFASRAATIFGKLPTALGTPAPTPGAGPLRWLLVAREHGDRGAHPPVGPRDPGVRGPPHGRADAGHDLESDAGFGQCECFFPAPAEHEGIAALEPHHEP